MGAKEKVIEGPEYQGKKGRLGDCCDEDGNSWGYGHPQIWHGGVMKSAVHLSGTVFYSARASVANPMIHRVM